jgi:hypothetical protein
MRILSLVLNQIRPHQNNFQSIRARSVTDVKVSIFTAPFVAFVLPVGVRDRSKPVTPSLCRTHHLATFGNNHDWNSSGPIFCSGADCAL